MLVRLKKADYSSLSLSMVKTHLRLNHSDEDEYLIHAMGVAGEILENYLSQSLLEQTWQYVWHNPHEKGISPLHSSEVVTIDLFFPPILDILSIQAMLSQKKIKELKRYRLITHGHKTQLVVTGAYPVLQVEYVAGMAKRAADLPAPLVQALLLIIAHLYEFRQSPEKGEIPMLTQLLQPFLHLGLN